MDSPPPVPGGVGVGGALCSASGGRDKGSECPEHEGAHSLDHSAMRAAGALRYSRCAPVPSEADGPVPSEAEGPVPSEVEGPVPSEAEGLSERSRGPVPSEVALHYLAVAALLVTAAVTGERVVAQLPLSARVHLSGLSAPVAFVQDPLDRAVQFVVEQGGRIRAVRNGALLPADFLDLRSAVRSGGEQGLLGLAFAPDAG